MSDQQNFFKKYRILNTLFALFLILGCLFLALVNTSCSGENCAATANGLDDADADCLDDTSDNCPFDYNPLQADADENGIGDVCEGDASINALPPSSVVEFEDGTEVQTDIIDSDDFEDELPEDYNDDVLEEHLSF